MTCLIFASEDAFPRCFGVFNKVHVYRYSKGNCSTHLGKGGMLSNTFNVSENKSLPNERVA